MKRRRKTTACEALERRALLAVITVTSLADTVADDGEVTLREAILAANSDQSVDGSAAGDGLDRIVFDTNANGTIRFENELVITESVSIEGNGPNHTIVDGRKARDGFHVPKGAHRVSLLLSGIRIRNTNRAVGHDGSAGSVRVSDSRIRFNRQGVVSAGSVTVTNVEFFRNNATVSGADGGALNVRSGSLRVYRCRFVENSSGKGSGGAIKLDGVTASIESSLFVANTAANSGGAIDAVNSDLWVANTTIKDSFSGAVGGAIYGLNSNASIAGSTIVDSRAGGDQGGGLFVDDTQLTITNSIIAGNQLESLGIHDDIALSRGAAITAKHSLIGSNLNSRLDANDGIADSDGNLIGRPDNPLDPQLGQLQDNGGPTHTIMPLPNSPVIDAGTATNLSSDQRSPIFPRVAGAAADMGAAEFVDAPFFTRVARRRVDEGSANLTRTVLVTLLADTAEGFDVTVTGEDRTAKSNHDYVPINQTLTFTGDEGETQQFDVTVINDVAVESHEHFGFRFVTTLTDTITGFTGATVQINDNDRLGIGLSGSTLTVVSNGLDDSVAIEPDGANINVTWNDHVIPFPADDVSGFELLLGAGKNSVDIAETIMLPASVVTGYGPDTILTGGGNDTVVSGGSEDMISTRGGADWVDSGGSNDTIFGGGGPDTLIGGRASDRLSGDDGSDLLIGQRARDTLVGGTGNDTLLGGGGPDHLIGGADADALFGHSVDSIEIDSDIDGDDLIEGDGGNDSIFGGTGRDNVFAGSGDDWIHAEGGILRGGPGNDSIVANSGSGLLINGGSGRDSISGNIGNDTLLGGPGPDLLSGWSGDDVVDGGGGDDTLHGGSGNDVLLGRAGDDQLFGDEETDEFDGADIAVGGTGTDKIFGRDGSDLLISGWTQLSRNDLLATLSEWKSEREYPVRRANLTDGAGSNDRSNGNVFLRDSGPDQNVFDDSQQDFVRGGPGIDWLFANLDQDDVAEDF